MPASLSVAFFFCLTLIASAVFFCGAQFGAWWVWREVSARGLVVAEPPPQASANGQPQLLKPTRRPSASAGERRVDPRRLSA